MPTVPLKGEWKSVIMVATTLSVMTIGIHWMPKWCASSLDFLPQFQVTVMTISVLIHVREKNQQKKKIGIIGK